MALQRRYSKTKRNPGADLESSVTGAEEPLTKVHSLALGEPASQLRLVHGFENEFEFD